MSLCKSLTSFEPIRDVEAVVSASEYSPRLVRCCAILHLVNGVSKCCCNWAQESPPDAEGGAAVATLTVYPTGDPVTANDTLCVPVDHEGDKWLPRLILLGISVRSSVEWISQCG